MKKRRSKLALTFLRWGVAIVGIWWVIANMNLRDHVLVLDARKVPVQAEVVEAGEGQFVVEVGQAVRTVTAADLVHAPDRDSVRLQTVAGTVTVPLLGLDIAGDFHKNPRVERLLVADPETGSGRWIEPGEVAGGFRLKVPHPLVEVGLISMVREADPGYLWGAVLVFPITYVVTSLRWHALLRALEINLTLARSFVLNMVGCFYNSFMPGSTGGDVLKAYYAAKQTPHKTRAVVSVIVDRVLGLLALVMLGGTMAGAKWVVGLRDGMAADPATVACGNVALMCGAITLAVFAGGGLFFSGRLRQRLGVDFLIRLLPLQSHVSKVMETVDIFRRRALLVVWALLVTFPVHITVVVSALLAGKAFGLPLSPGYYFVVVPVVVLVGAIPISPQGAGVMEFFAILLTAKQGGTVNEAFALTMSIRAVQVMWNLTGGIFVLKGGFHAPTDAEQEQVAEGGIPVAGVERVPSP